MLSLAVATTLLAASAQPPPEPTLVFGTTIRISEAYANSPDAPAGDGCAAAEARLASGSGVVVSKVVFDAARGRLRQSNARLERQPTQNLTNIGRWEGGKARRLQY